MKIENRKKQAKNRKITKDDLYQPYRKKPKKVQLSRINKKEIRKVLAQRLKIKGKQSTEMKLDGSKIFNIVDSQIINCSICLQLFMLPTTLLCGHTFCYSCLKELVKSFYKETCPLCRTSFSCQILQINRDMDYLLNILYNTKFSQDEKIKYDSRKRDIEKRLNDENHCINFTSIQLKTKLQMKIGNHQETGEVTNILKGKVSSIIELRSLKDDSIYAFKSSTLNLNLRNPQNTIAIGEAMNHQNTIVVGNGINPQNIIVVGDQISDDSQFSQGFSEISFNQYFAQLHPVEYFPLID